MPDNLDSLYDEKFYKHNVPGMSSSAAVVLGMLYAFCSPRSVVDVGCGQGAWLAAAELLGATTLKGFDGDWVRREALLSRNIDFTAVNFEQAIPELEQQYDLCISLEVAEHVSAKNAEKFVDLLCEASGTVLFGAAIKHQGGVNHVNEQWQSYWIDRFKQRGYECLDIFRSRLWDNNKVEWWYRQNTFLFVSPGNTLALDLDRLRAMQEPVMDIVHPRNYERKINYLDYPETPPTWRFCLSCIKQYLLNRIRQLGKKA